MVSYVVSSMTEGAEFDFVTGAIVSLGVSVLIIAATAILPGGPAEKH
jgi:hypothetical protein